MYAAGGDDELVVVDLVGRTKLGTPLSPQLGIAARYSPDGRRLAVVRPDGGVSVLDPETGESLSSLRAPDTVPIPAGVGLVGFDFNSDASQLAVGGFNGRLTVFDVTTGNVLRTIPVPFEPPNSEFFPGYGPLGKDFVNLVDWSPDDRSIATGTFDDVTVFDATSGTLRFRTKAFKNLMLTIAFSPDSRFVVGASFDGIAHILDATTGERVGAPLGTGNFEASYAVWLPGGDAIALTNPRAKVIRIVEVTTRRQIGPEYRPGAGIPRVTPDRALLLSSSTSGDFRLFDVAAGAQVGDIIPFKSQVGVVSMAPDGKAAVSSGAEGHIRWDIDPESWKRKACEVAGRNLTADEWATYLPGEPYRPTCAQWPARA